MCSKVCFALFIGIFAGSVLPALAFPQLPLYEGEFTRGECRMKAGDSIRHADQFESISVYLILEGKRHYQFVSPVAEEQNGYCTIKPFKVSGDRYTGKAPCEDGGNKVRYPSGTYALDWQIVNGHTFVSRGVTFKWCAPHR